MKTREKALEEWTLDEIMFDDDAIHLRGGKKETGLHKYSRQEFENICENMHRDLTVRGADRFMDLIHGNFVLEESFKRWTARFFYPNNLVRYESKREVGDAMTQRLERIRDAIVITGEFHDIPIETLL